MKTRWTPGILLQLVALCLTGCATTPVPQSVAEPEAYDFTREGNFPEPPQIAPAPTSLGSAAPESPPAQRDDAFEQTGSAAGSQSAAPTTWGWRVQVFAGASQETAISMSKELQNAFAEKVYVQYLDPYYKVRIGDCETRETCLELQNVLRARGWNTAWVVPSAILK